MNFEKQNKYKQNKNKTNTNNTGQREAGGMIIREWCYLQQAEGLSSSQPSSSSSAAPYSPVEEAEEEEVWIGSYIYVRKHPIYSPSVSTYSTPARGMDNHARVGGSLRDMERDGVQGGGLAGTCPVRCEFLAQITVSPYAT